MKFNHPAEDSTLVICCSYRVCGIEFRPMTAYKDGRFVCRDCAHTVRPGVPGYKCLCRNCSDQASVTKRVFSSNA